jgi:predicted DCC family thiol-disulfide oxidoreductase YuxK
MARSTEGMDGGSEADEAVMPGGLAMDETPVPKPIVIFDGKCGFCRIWIDYFRLVTRGAVDFAPYQDAAPAYPNIPVERFKRAVHLIQPSGEVLSGARAAFELLPGRWLVSLYRHVPGFAGLSEAAYRFIAEHRNLFYYLTILFFGRKVETLTFDAVQWLFLRLLAITYLIAFASFGMQAGGLIGSHGILPVSQYLARISEGWGGSGYRIAPTLFWFNATDAAVQVVWIAGVISALLVLFGVLWRAALAAAFLLYLSLVNGSQEFLSFQWDYLLLEVGFLAIFLGYSRSIVWLFRWLLFRLMFFSGVVKLLSGDLTWRNLTALTVHYQTQPIPTPLAWYAQQMPRWFQQMSCAGVFFVELFIPLFVLGPRRARLFALPWLLALQGLIVLTGNYAFFNLLAISLCVFLVDDAVLRRVFRPGAPGRMFVPQRIRQAVAWSLVVLIAVLSGLLGLQTFAGDVPAAGRALLGVAAPFGIVNSYGLFANMTTTRPEIIVEGSNDGAEWRSYEFKYKPGRLDRRPPWVAPYQPRLDWQMWFAALGSYRENVWFLNLLARLLQGQPEVLQLIDYNPFPNRPPRFARAQIFEYRFTDSAMRDRTRQWWVRTPLGVYVPPVSLSSLSNLRILQASP